MLDHEVLWNIRLAMQQKECLDYILGGNENIIPEANTYLQS